MIAVTDAHGQPLKYINVRVSKTGQTSDQAIDDRFTDLAGHTAWPGGFVGGEHWTACTLHINDRNVNPAYGDAHVNVPDLDGQPITVQLTGGTPAVTCPDPHDKGAVHDWFFTVAAAAGAHTNTVQNRINMKDGLVACGAAWQNQCVYSPDKWRARFFLQAHGPNCDSDFVVDTGNENGPFELTFRY